MRKLLIVLGILVVAFVVLDMVARSVAENRVASAVQSSLDLEREPDVSLGGWPFIVKALSGNLPAIVIEGESITEGPVTLSEVSLHLRDVSFSLQRALAGNVNVEVGDGSGTAEIGERSLQRTLDEQGTGATVDLRDGRILLQRDGIPGEIEATPSLDGSTLVLSGSGGSVELDLPPVIEGLHYRSVAVQGARLFVEFDLDETELLER